MLEFFSFFKSTISTNCPCLAQLLNFLNPTKIRVILQLDGRFYSLLIPACLLVLFAGYKLRFSEMEVNYDFVALGLDVGLTLQLSTNPFWRNDVHLF